MAGHKARSILYRILTVRPLDRATLYLLKDAVKRFGGLLPRDVLTGLNLFFFRDLIGNIDRDGDGAEDSFRFAITNAWFDQRITGIDLRVDGRPISSDRIVFRYPAGETRACDVTALEFTPGDATEIVIEGLTLADGLHLLDMTLDMELVGQIIPILPILMRRGVGDFPVLEDCFNAFPVFPPESLEPGTVHLVPHVHYDVEWQHTRDTFERVGWANLREMLRLMDEDPEMTFVLDQVPQLEPFSRRDPAGFEEIVKLVGEGRIEMVNGMYCEPDVNLLSGETLVRQSVAWQDYALEKFGTLSRCGWLIDSFGMSAQLPQIFSLSGTEFFAYSRARPPEGTPTEFLWEGVDGTRIPTHNMHYMYLVGYPMPTDRTRAKKKMLRNYLRLRVLSATDQVLYPSGVDHGRPQKTNGQMIRAWNEEVNDVKFTFSLPSRFFQSFSTADLPVVKGELQREMVGTYSSRISIKRLNRESEFALLDAEKLSSLAAIKGAAFPREELDGAWRALMDNQFHDQICGCCTDEVASGMRDRFKDAIDTAGAAMNDAASRLAGADGEAGNCFTILAFNPMSTPVTSLVEFEVILPPGWKGLHLESDGVQEHVQVMDSTCYGDGSLRRVSAVFRPSLPALGYRIFSLTAGDGVQPEVTAPVRVTGTKLVNGLLSLSVDGRTGLLERVELSDGTALDLSGGNRLSMERDFGDLYNVVTLGTAFMHRRKIESVRVVEAGPLRGTLEVKGTIGRSPFTHRISLASGSPRIDIETVVDFNNPGYRLRCEFPTGFKGGEWTREIPYGCIESPGHELPAQNFVDASRDGRGLSLINYGIPGNSYEDGRIYLTLLRSTDKIYEWNSGPDALELGRHVFRYSLFPHSGDWRNAGTAREAYGRNNSPRYFIFNGRPSGGRPTSGSALELRCENALVSAVKINENGDVVARLWETNGKPAEAELLFGWSPTGAKKTDLLEREIEDLPLEGNRLELRLRPFEIATLLTRL